MFFFTLDLELNGNNVVPSLLKNNLLSPGSVASLLEGVHISVSVLKSCVHLKKTNPNMKFFQQRLLIAKWGCKDFCTFEFFYIMNQNGDGKEKCLF